MFRASECLSGHYDNFTPSDLWQCIIDNYIVDESAYIEELLTLVDSDGPLQAETTTKTRDIIAHVRNNEKSREGVEAFLQQYSLDTEEGIILMCLAEALLRIPDSEVANQLIKSKLGSADWDKHVGQSESKLVNASTWGLMLTGKIVGLTPGFEQKNTGSLLNRLINKFGEPVIRSALNQAMKLMGKQFVLGRNIKEAVSRGANDTTKGYTHSFDMLGEAALTRKDSDKYLADYKKAITFIGSKNGSDAVSRTSASISIKLSALHPRYESTQKARVITELVPTVIELVEHARTNGVALTIDAEEADRLEISLLLFEKVLEHEVCRHWNHFGLVVQAYSKRALPVLQWLKALAKTHSKQLPIRLVKGAYWDSEIKWAQQMGLDGYPVFTRKVATDVSYLACARFMLSHTDAFYPQFATHNAQTVMSILAAKPDCQHFEFQRLHGMGEMLYDSVLAQHNGLTCRIYAPVGEHRDLLPYLVRRLLENGANTSFVHRLVDPKTPVDALAVHPVGKLKACTPLHNDKIPLPAKMLGPSRQNSRGINLHAESNYSTLLASYHAHLEGQWHGSPLVNGTVVQSEKKQVLCPYDLSRTVGSMSDASEQDALAALDHAHQAFTAWNNTGHELRASKLNAVADTFEQHKAELIALCTLEGGKTFQDGIDEVREAIDFCRYYAEQLLARFAPIRLPGPTGESNEIQLSGRGVFSCISPWNFPLAIFTGQIAAALAAGNCVLAKPAGQTRLIAWRAVQLMHEAGIPKNVLHFLPGSAAVIGKVLTTHEKISGVAFTGSTQTAQHINRALAARGSAIAPFIAETGGQNAMIVDSSALPEQVVNDVIHSAFTSAGQRCSALRVLYVQKDIADRVIELLKGAMNELCVDRPHQLSTDLGPVIDAASKQELLAHAQFLESEGRLIAKVPLASSLAEAGHFIAPCAFKIDRIADLEQEFFGPILHVITYRSKELDKIIDDINGYGYGLTLGVHSRDEDTAAHIAQRAKVGNVYINRNMIGATVGVQPFGGQGLSGTGPKAGGPHYLPRFATEKTITNNTAAIGGNATLLSLDDD